MGEPNEKQLLPLISVSSIRARITFSSADRYIITVVALSFQLVLEIDDSLIGKNRTTARQTTSIKTSFSTVTSDKETRTNATRPKSITELHFCVKASRHGREPM